MSKENASEKNENMHMGHIEIDARRFGKDPNLGNLPVLPTRNLALFPGVTVPLNIGRPGSLELVRKASESGDPIAVICQTDSDEDSPSIDGGLIQYGVVADVFKVLEMPDETHTAIIHARERFRVYGPGSDPKASPTGLTVKVRRMKDLQPENAAELELVVGWCLDEALQIMRATAGMEKEFESMIKSMPDSEARLNHMATNLPLPVEDKALMLAESHLLERANLLLGALVKENQKVKVREEIMNRAGENMRESQRNAFLQQQLDAIKEELYGSANVPDNDDDASELLKRAEAVRFPADVRTVFEKEVGRLRRLSPQSPDYSVQYAYLETLLELPWGVDWLSDEEVTVQRARRVLQEEHYGLEKVKDRILEQIAVVLNGGAAKAPILCLVGPPGVGKTSLGRSIARAMGRKYVRVSLGGVHDESEIRGHRRTYVGSMPGRILKALKSVEVANPVMVLDEIDKIGRDHRGDPADALLEVLDPEQNHAFHDNFVDVDFDLSHVLFIATANTLSTVPRPLLDRMEVIELSGYLPEEKKEIARRHLLLRVREDNNAPEFDISDAALDKLIDEYTSESGVRQLEKRLGSLVRKEILARLDEKPVEIPLQPESLRPLLGLPSHHRDKVDDTGLPGVVTGLAWTEVGGEILLAEASLSEGKGDKLTLTGNLGDVMKESATIALQWVRSHAADLGIPREAFDNHTLHVHFPEGAIPKDGPSAGITIATAIVSAYTGRPAKPTVAMTGEITLRGRVLAVGGVKEKILAAKRAGVTDIILSDDNRRDIEEITADYLTGLTFHYVKTVQEVIPLALV